MEIPAHRRLRGNNSSSNGRRREHGNRIPDALGLFHHHAKLEAFVFADYYLIEKPRLCFQDVRSGKQLRLVVCEQFPSTQEGALGETYEWEYEDVLLDAAVSLDERRFACVYSAKGDCSFFTCVWELRQATSPDQILNEENEWAQVIFHTETYQPMFQRSAGHVVLVDNNVLWFPAGRVDLRTGKTTPFAIAPPPPSQGTDEVRGGADDTTDADTLTLYGTSEFIASSRDQGWRGASVAGYRYSVSGVRLQAIERPHARFSESKIKCGNIVRLDPSGRFIIWSSIDRKRSGTVMHNTMTGAAVALNHPSGETIRHITFLPDAKLAVFAFYTANHLDLTITTWNLSLESGALVKLASRSFRNNLCGLCVPKGGDVLFLVTSGRILSRLTLPDLQEQDDVAGFCGKDRHDVKFVMSSGGTELGSLLTTPTR